MNPTDLQARLEVFAGYLELGMFADANDELENLPAHWKVHPQVLHARFCLLIEMKRWDDGIILGQSLIRLWPQEPEFWLKTAYCQHELRLTREARATLLAAPAAIQKVAVFSYNMACYEARLGHIGEAKRFLKICFEQDRRFRSDALDDPDLQAVWDSIRNL